jgi:hypothetical protein
MLPLVLDAGRLSDPSWMLFFVMTGIGTVGLMLLLILYPVSADDPSELNPVAELVDRRAAFGLAGLLFAAWLALVIALVAGWI